MSGRVFLFLDLETTGLNPEREQIIEAAWTFTDEKFETIGEPRTFLVEPRDWNTFWASVRGTPVVRDMHTVSGLLADLVASDPVAVDDVADVLLRDIRDLPEHSALHLAGLSVHFDRDFLRANGFGWALERIHHRHLDLSAVKLLLSALGVSYPEPANSNPHRALADVLATVEQARLLAAAATAVRL